MLLSVRSYATDKVQPQFMFFDKIENKMFRNFPIWAQTSKITKKYFRVTGYIYEELSAIWVRHSIITIRTTTPTLSTTLQSKIQLSSEVNFFDNWIHKIKRIKKWCFKKPSKNGDFFEEALRLRKDFWHSY